MGKLLVWSSARRRIGDNGSVTPASTYTVNPDCTGKKQVNFAINNPPPRITYFVVTGSGDQLLFVSGTAVLHDLA